MPSTALYVVEFRFTGGFESYSAHHFFKHLQAFQIWIWGHFSNLLDDASLRFALRRGHSLNVRVHGDTDVCMAHQCLPSPLRTALSHRVCSIGGFFCLQNHE